MHLKNINSGVAISRDDKKEHTCVIKSRIIQRMNDEKEIEKIEVEEGEGMADGKTDEENGGEKKGEEVEGESGGEEEGGDDDELDGDEEYEEESGEEEEGEEEEEEDSSDDESIPEPPPSNRFDRAYFQQKIHDPEPTKLM